MINYPTGLAIGDKVKIISGLYRGRVGVVVGAHARGFMPQGLVHYKTSCDQCYEVKLKSFWSWFTSPVYCLEDALELREMVL